MLDKLPPTIPHAACRAAERWHEAPAIIDQGETWSFARLWRESRAVASALIERGITSGDRIAIWGPNSREWIVAAIAAQTCGATIVPLNTRLKGREAGDILRRAQVRLLFTVGEFLGTNYPALLADEDLPHLAQTILLDQGYLRFKTTGWGENDPRVVRALAQVTPEHISDIMFTSGTTGTPKGVLTAHGRMLPQCAAWIDNTRLCEGERYLLVNPFFHSFGMKVGWIACLLTGAAIVPMAQFEIAEAVALIERERISFLPGPPTIFQMLLAEYDRCPFDTTSLRGGTTGAATVPPALVERIRSDLGMSDLVTAYGMTECTVITSCRPGDSVARIAQTCGRALPGVEVKISDEAGLALGPGEAGEILVRGQGIMLGYLDDAEATAQAIDPGGWLHTGDVGIMDEDGYLRIVDRKKDLYISGGFNCYPAEIEKLLSDHPAIASVAVIGVVDERMGEVGKAFVVLRPSYAVTEPELTAWSRENMANYKVPRSFVFVNELPQTASGKVDKLKLRG